MNDLVLLAKALADATRVRLLTLVSSRGQVCCGDLARALDVSQATVTHHLRVLSSARLIETHRDGQFIRVKACRPGIEACRVALNRLLPEAQLPHSPGLATQRPAPLDDEVHTKTSSGEADGHRAESVP